MKPRISKIIRALCLVTVAIVGWGAPFHSGQAQELGQTFTFSRITRDTDFNFQTSEGKTARPKVSLKDRGFKVTGTPENAWYVEIKMEGDKNTYRISKSVLQKAIREGAILSRESPKRKEPVVAPASSEAPQAPELQEIKVGSQVFLDESMNCRSSGDWRSEADNISDVGLVPEGSQGVVTEIVHNRAGKVAGYAIRFQGLVEGSDSKTICYIHAPGVSMLPGEPKITAEQCENPKGDVGKTVEKLNEEAEKVTEKYSEGIPLKHLSPEKDCEKPYAKCDASIPKSNKYDALILDVANEFGLPPALIKAQVAAESSFGAPTTENTTEKNAYLAYISGRAPNLSSAYRQVLWGRGLGQFGADNSFQYGMAWYQNQSEVEKWCPARTRFAEARKSKASEAQLAQLRLDTRCFIPGDKYEGQNLKSVFDPSAAIRAKTQMLYEISKKKYMASIQSKDGSVHNVNVTAVLKQNPTEFYRTIVAAYNRGTKRVENSIKAFVSNQKNKGLVPAHYVDIAFAKVPSDAKEREAAGLPASPGSYLIAQKISRCHVYKNLRICGEAGGFFAEYEKDFTQSADGSWKAKGKAG